MLLQALRWQVKGARIVLCCQLDSVFKNNLNEFKAGSFKAAYKSKCPIIPVALINSFLPFDENNDEPVIVQVHFLKPIYYDEYCNKKTNEIAMMVQQQIQTVINDYS